MDQLGSSSASGSGKAGILESSVLPVVTTIDDIVSLVRSVEAAPESSTSNLVPTQVYEILLPALKRQYHAQKGKGFRVFQHSLQGGIDPLDMLDPARNSLGYAYVLACRAGQVGDVESAQIITGFINVFAQSFVPAQLIGAGEIVLVLARNIAHIGQLLTNPIGALTSLLRLFDGFRSVNGGHHHLTALHPLIVYQCLRAQHYHAAVDWVLQYDIINADESVTPLLYSDVLEYLYYGGMVWAKVHQLDKACEFFELCVTFPAHQVSAIQLDAYKKLILLQLLKDGKTSPLPRYTSQAVHRATRSKIASIEIYQNFAKAYEAELNVKLYSTDKEKIQREAYAIQENLEREVTKGMEVLSKDQNFGLVRKLLDLFTSRKIQRLSRLFNRMKVGDIVNLLGGRVGGAVGDEACEVVLNALQQMDADRWIRLDIQRHEGSLPPDVIVQFSDYQVDHAGLEAAQRLTNVMQQAKFWNQIVEHKRKSVRNSETYLAKQMNPAARGAFGASHVEEFDEDAFN